MTLFGLVKRRDDNFDGVRGSVTLAKLANDPVDIVGVINRMIPDFSDKGTIDELLESIFATFLLLSWLKIGRNTTNVVDEGTFMCFGVAHVDAKGTFKIIKIKVDDDSFEFVERLREDANVRIGVIACLVCFNIFGVGIRELTKQTSIGRSFLERKITHGLVERDVLSCLDVFGFHIKIVDLRSGGWVSKENAGDGIVNSLVRTVWTCWLDINTATKDTEHVNFWLDLGADKERRVNIDAMRSDIVDLEKVKKGIRPIFWFKTSAMQHGTNGVTDGAVRTFTRTILMRRIRGCRFTFVPSLLKEFPYFLRSAKFTTKIKANIFVLDVRTKTMLSKPFIEICNRSFLGRKAATIEETTVVVNNKAIACFAMRRL